MSDPNYPKAFYEGGDNNTAGFVTPYKLATGSLRGTQTISGSLVIRNVGGSSGGNNTVISMDGINQYTLYRDPVSNVNQIIIGKLPDGSYGLVISKPGIDVLTVFT